MPNSKRKLLMFLLVVVPIYFLILFVEGTSVCCAVEVLDSFTQGFQTVGARYQQVPTNITPDCTYVVPIRFNFGEPDSGQYLNARLFGPGGITYFEYDFPAYDFYGGEDILIEVHSSVPIGENVSWGVQLYDNTGLVSEATATEITLVQDPTIFDDLLDGVVVNPGWTGSFSSLGCSENEVDDCLRELTQNPISRFFDWLGSLFNTVTCEATTENQYSIGTPVQKAHASRLRAFKLFKGLEQGDNQSGQYILNGVGARQEMVITNNPSFALNGTGGYTVQGKQKVSNHPPGWGGDGKDVALGIFPMDPVMQQFGFVEINVASERFAVVPPQNDYMVDYGSHSSSDTGYADDDPGGLEERIDIDFTVEYDNITQTITVTYGVSGNAEWSMWEVCKVKIYGGSSGSATYSAAGDEVEMEFALMQAGVSVGCGTHPCWHGEVECNVGIIMEVTYPDECTSRFEFFLDASAGAHGEFFVPAASQSYEICTTYRQSLGAWEYDICPDAQVQSWIGQNFSSLLESFNYDYVATIGYILQNF